MYPIYKIQYTRFNILYIIYETQTYNTWYLISKLWILICKYDLKLQFIIWYNYINEIKSFGKISYRYQQNWCFIKINPKDVNNLKKLKEKGIPLNLILNYNDKKNTIVVTETNKKIRTGRSEDEDGKTNVWSVEPKMEIVEEKNNSLKILGVIIGTLSLTFQFYSLMTPFLSNLSEQ